ncbi:MAG: glycosyltransferase family 2 protein [Lachnospiraceae bacterium]|nr:glycosyltransferase family 2 protein [Lachnospiraceae bacterium]
MGNKPLISVIMAVYNEEKYIEKSLHSILNQTLQDFEIIIFDDCSTDKTVQIINNIQDERIHLYKNSENQGLTKNLNQGLRLAQGQYIARMDGDDFSLPTRFEKQIDYFQHHPDVMLISCWAQDFGESMLRWKLRENSEELKTRMLVKPVFAHPGFMMKKELIEKGYFYDESFRTAQDYEFASRVAYQYEIGIVQEILLFYRVHKKQISNLAGKEQFSNADRVREQLWNQVGVQLSDQEKKELQCWAKEEQLSSIEKYVNINNLIYRISEANKESGIYSQDTLERTLNRLLYIWVIHTRNIKLLLAFPKVCRYHRKNMILFVKELFGIIIEKFQNRGADGNATAVLKTENL